MQQTMIAAVVYEDEGVEAKKVFWAALRQLQAQGVRVAGLMNKCRADGEPLSEVIQSVTDNREYTILQDLGRDSGGCRLNPQALAQSSEVLRDAIADQADILFINCFGTSESQGNGLFAEFSTALMAGIPVVSLVFCDYLPKWREFSAEFGEELTISADEIVHWVQERINP